MNKKLSLGVLIAPYIVTIVLAALYVGAWVRNNAIRKQLLNDVPAEARGTIRNVEVYRKSDSWTIFSYDDVLLGEEMCVLETSRLQIVVYQKPSDANYTHVAIRAGNPPQALLSVGVTKGQSFPGFVAYTPRSGQDKGRVLGDYDLDGGFEVRWPKGTEWQMKESCGEGQ